LVKNDKKLNQESVYQSSGYYKVGQWIYHPVFKDKGKVIKIFPAPGDLSIIIVKFEKVGEKKLIAREICSIQDKMKKS